MFGWAIGLSIALLGLIVWATYEDHKSWEAFASTHNCKKVGYIRGDVFNTVGVGANGQMTVGIGSTPGKTGWHCDDGMTYWR